MRPITGREELGFFCQLPYVLNEELADDLAEGRRRPEWMWVARHGDQLLARVAWWCPRGDDRPRLLDILDIDDTSRDPHRVDIGNRLLNTAMAVALPTGSRPPYSRFIPPGWRDSAVSQHVVSDRMTVLERTGARLYVERLRLEWRPESLLPEPGRRLVFRPVRGAEELLAMMTLALDGTLDAHSRDQMTLMPTRSSPTSRCCPRTAATATSRWRRPSSALDTSISSVRSK